MRGEDLRRLLERQPSPRLRLHLTNGIVFEINDPDLVVLGRSTVELLLPPDDTGEREAIVNLLHVIWVEVLSPPLDRQRLGEGGPFLGAITVRRPTPRHGS